MATGRQAGLGVSSSLGAMTSDYAARKGEFSGMTRLSFKYPADLADYRRHQEDYPTLIPDRYLQQ